MATAVAEGRAVGHKRVTGGLQIVVMEDEDMNQIIGTLESMECGVSLVSSRDEAVRLAEEGSARFFILDIRMGPDRFNEGMDTLEEIKNIDSDIFVAMYTGYARRDYRDQATNLGADLFVEKKANVTGELGLIVARMWKRYNQQQLSQEQQEGTSFESDEEQYSPEFALNYNAFQDLLADAELFAEYQNYYVAFIDGKLVRSSSNRDELLSWLIADRTEAPKFYALVHDQDDEPVEWLPSPLSTEDL